MQANTITLAVDLLNSGSTTNKVFTRFSEDLNRSTYVGPDHTLQSRHMMQLYRTLPKRVGNFLGTAKSAVKFTRDFTVAGADGEDVVAPFIGDVNFSIPVGLTAAETLELRQYLVAALDNAFTASLNDIQEI